MKAEDGKAKASCCAGKDASGDSKDAMSCMKNDKDKTAASCCKDGCGKDSCAKDKTAAACCSGKCAKDGREKLLLRNEEREDGQELLRKRDAQLARTFDPPERGPGDLSRGLFFFFFRV